MTKFFDMLAGWLLADRLDRLDLRRELRRLDV